MKNSNKLVRGIGVNDAEGIVSEKGKACKAYILWSGMLLRCTKAWWLRYPTYNDVTCSENFKSYTYFCKWCDEQIGENEKDENGTSWQLDKDLLVRGNKLYSEDTCCFVPRRINSLLVKSDKLRGDCLIGTYYNNFSKKYLAQCNNGTGKQKYLGSFNTPQEAFQAYKTYKEALIKEVANEYKEMLDSRVYEALMNYEVNEND